MTAPSENRRARRNAGSCGGRAMRAGNYNQRENGVARDLAPAFRLGDGHSVSGSCGEPEARGLTFWFQIVRSEVIAENGLAVPVDQGGVKFRRSDGAVRLHFEENVGLDRAADQIRVVHIQ